MRRPTMEIPKKVQKQMIEMYWERNCLWQLGHEHYKNRVHKKRAYSEIAAFLRRSGVAGVSETAVQKKIQNLRRVWRKEQKRVEDSGGTYSPTLWYYDLLSFVTDQEEFYTSEATSYQNQDTLSEKLSDVESEDEEPIAVNIVKEENRLQPTKIQAMKRKRHTREEYEFKDVDEDAVTVPRYTETDEYTAMGINFAAKIKRMEATQQIYAELLIQKVLTKGLFGKLEEKTDLT